MAKAQAEGRLFEPLGDGEVTRLRASLENLNRGGEPLMALDRLQHVFGEGDTATRVLNLTDGEPGDADQRIRIWPGELVVLIGESGCGKTTLLTLLGGLRKIQPGRGDVRVFGEQLLGMSDEALNKLRRDIGFIFQSHNLFQSLTARQNVRMGLEAGDPIPPAGDPRPAQILTRLGLGDRLEYKPSGLSGGQRQRVAIARALVGGPNLVLADEPTAALDEVVTGEVLRLFRELANDPDRQTAFVIVTHDPRVISRADRIIELKKGGRVISQRDVKLCTVLAHYMVSWERFHDFQLLTPDALIEVAERMRPERFAAGDAVIRQGEPGEKFYVIWDGSVSIRRLPTNDPAVIRAEHDRGNGGDTVATLGRGAVFGEQALRDDAPRNASVVAEQDLVVYSLDEQNYRRARGDNMSFQDQVAKVIRRAGVGA